MLSLLLLILLPFVVVTSNAFIIDGRPKQQQQRSSSTLTILLSAESELSTLSNEEISRYSRHLVLSDVGIIGQEKLKNSAILVIGAGGLGSPVLMYLAAAGIGHIGIVDNDIVDESNLQRQIIHSISSVGQSKCISAKNTILNINPHINVKLYETEFTSQTAKEIISEGFSSNKSWDVIIDGSDNFPTKYLINDVCAMYGIPWIYSAILAFEGQVSVFNVIPNISPDYRDLLPIPPPPGDVPSCAEGGVLGVLPGTMGCIQATEAIKLILGKTDGLLSGRVLVFDALKMNFNYIHIQRDPNRQPITELIDYKGFCGGPTTTTTIQTNTNDNDNNNKNQRTMDEDQDNISVSSSTTTTLYHDIDPKSCLNKLLNGWSPFVLDVRLQTENDIVSLPFTDRVVPHRSVKITDIPSEGDVLVYCKAGVRGKKACNTLINAGIEPNRLYNLQGGIMKWQKDIDPSMPRY